MGVARQDNPLCLFRFVRENTEQVQEFLSHQRNFLFRIKPEIQNHLIVSASRGVQFACYVPYLFPKSLLNVDVHILEVLSKRYLAFIEISLYLLQAFLDYPSISSRDDFLLAQHSHVSQAARDVFLIKPLINRDRCIELGKKLIHILGKTPLTYTRRCPVLRLFLFSVSCHTLIPQRIPINREWT